MEFERRNIIVTSKLENLRISYKASYLVNSWFCFVGGLFYKTHHHLQCVINYCFIEELNN